jgi:uncharacterized protein
MKTVTNLDEMLQGLDPVLAGTWAFCVVPADFDFRNSLMMFREEEGTTALVHVDKSDGLDVRFIGTRIVLRVNSSLEATGLTAAVSKVLAELSIPTNIVAAVHHDHLFVPESQAELALAALIELSAQNTSEKISQPK